jgi:hypothetical protein
MRKNATLGIIIILIGIVWTLKQLDFFSFSIVDVFFGLWLSSGAILIGIGFILSSKTMTF